MLGRSIMPIPFQAQLAHVAFWTRDLDASAAFWKEHFGAEVGELYHSKRQPGFTSRFLRLPNSNLVLELMSAPWVGDADDKTRTGCTHLAISLGGSDQVDAAAKHFAALGLLAAAPRTTGDGFYEALVKMPDGTLLEITA